MRSIEESLRSEQCRRILEALKAGPKNSEVLAKETKLTVGSIVKHANVLVAAGLVVETEVATYAIRR